MIRVTRSFLRVLVTWYNLANFRMALKLLFLNGSLSERRYKQTEIEEGKLCLRLKKKFSNLKEQCHEDFAVLGQFCA